MSKIKEARLAAGLTQKAIIEAIGIPRRTLQHYEVGDREVPGWIEKLLINEIERISKAR